MTIDNTAYRIGTLPSGLRYCLRRNRSNVAYCALTIRAGTRDEEGLPEGSAHMTEHMLFRGTDRRTPLSIDNCLEKCGGDLNAYTAKEEIVINATVLQRDIRRAVDLILELAFRSEFDPDELEKEKTVVLDEISSFADSPSDSIFDSFEKILFKGHPLSGLILGNAKSVRSIRSGDLAAFRDGNFRPERMALTVEADMDEETFRKIVERSFEKNFKGTAQAVSVQAEMPNTVSCLSIGTPFSTTVAGKHHQANCIIGCSAYSLYDSRRFALILLNNILGGPESGSLLNKVLRERNALVYSVESGYTQYADTGVLTFYFGCDKGNLDKCIRLTRETLEKVRSKPFSLSALKAAKRQLLGQIAIASDSGETQVLSMGKSIISYNHILSDLKAEEKINSITAEEVLEAAREVLTPERLATLVYR